MLNAVWSVAIVIITGLFSDVGWAVPYDLSYGGRLAESNGKPAEGPVTLSVQFYRSEAGSDLIGGVTIPLFTDVVLSDGIFQLTISLTPAEFHLVFNDSQPVWIQITDVTHNRTYPRQKYSAVPYALKVPVDGESITYNVDGELTLSATGGAAGKFLKYASPGVLIWDSIPGGGDMLKSNNLSDLADPAAARTNLGLGNAATKSVGTGAGDVASGNHTHPSGDVSGLGGLATKSVVGSSDITDGSVTGTDIADGTITDADINATANISYLKISGLGSAASKDVGTAAGEVAAGNHTHASGDVSGLGTLATKSAVGSSDITDDTVASGDIADGTIINADISASAAIAGSKVHPDFGSQNVVTTGNATVATLQANTSVKLKSDNANAVTIQSPAGLAAGYTLILPVDDGTSGQVLTTDGSGGLTWNTVSGGGGGDMLKVNNLSDLTDASAARSNLGLGALATKSAVGSSDITDGSVTGSDMASGTITDANVSASAAISTSKISGLGSLATKSAVGSSDITDGSVSGTDIADGTITDADINATANISYLKISGLGSAASKDVGTAAGEVAAGNHNHASGDISGLGTLATKSAVSSSDITDNTVASGDIADGTIVNADINASAAIAGSKVNPDFGSQPISTTGTVTADTVKATAHLQTATSSGAPIASECDDASEYGRLKTDTANNKLYVCSTSGWVAAMGTGFLTPANNLSDLGDAATARANLGLGALATKSAVETSDITDGSVSGTDIADGTITDADIHATANISYLKISGLGGAASKNVGSAAGTVAAGDHGHADATTSAAGFMSAADKTKLDGIASGAGVDTNTKTLCADGEFLRGETTTTCKTSTQIVSDGGGVTTSDTGTVTSAMVADGTIADADISGTAAIAGTKISPNFGSQNIATTGTISGNGSGLTNVPVGITACPSGFSMVGTAGARGTFCIDTNQRTASNFYTAKATCHNLSLAEGKATMCDHDEWYEACDKGLATGMTGDLEWVADMVDATLAFTNGALGCASVDETATNLLKPFRCCVR